MIARSDRCGGESIPPELDDIDRRLIAALQVDARASVSSLAAEVHLSTSPTWRRERRLEREGVISGYAARLDRRALGWGVMAFISVTIGEHRESEARAFERAVGELPEIVSCWSTAGDSDFVLQVVARDLDHYADFAMNTVRRLPGIRSMRSVLTLKDIKVASSWPLPGTPSSTGGR